MNKEKERYDYFVQNIRQYGDFPEVLEKHTWEFISDLLKKRDGDILEILTHKIDESNLLPDWERYWKEITPGRFVCKCGECDGGDRIIKLLSTLNIK